MEAKLYRPEQLRTGMHVSYEREVTEEDVVSFARLTGDHNPLHVDSDYAKESSYQGRIVHGAFQVGMASALLGMHLPGKNVLLGSINSRFPSALYFPTRAKISGEITSWNLNTLGGQLKVLVQDAGSLKATAEISMGFTLHDRRSGITADAAVYEEKKEAVEVGAARKLVVVTGASGGLGSAIVTALANEFHVLAVTNQRSLPEELRSLPNVCEYKIDFGSVKMEESLVSQIGARPIYGIVHAAWPSAPRGSLLHSDEDSLRSQVEFGTVLTVRLARLLFANADPTGARFVGLGSTAGSLKPYLPMGVYSLAKACLESTIRLLAPELARKKITINAACPSFMPVGINKEADERKRLQEAAAIPMGRLCQTDDVVGMIRYLLSPEASFVSGQMFALTGAQL